MIVEKNTDSRWWNKIDDERIPIIKIGIYLDTMFNTKVQRSLRQYNLPEYVCTLSNVKLCGLVPNFVCAIIISSAWGSTACQKEKDPNATPLIFALGTTMALGHLLPLSPISINKIGRSLVFISCPSVTVRLVPIEFSNKYIRSILETLPMDKERFVMVPSKFTDDPSIVKLLPILMVTVEHNGMDVSSVPRKVDILTVFC